MKAYHSLSGITGVQAPQFAIDYSVQTLTVFTRYVLALLNQTTPHKQTSKQYFKEIVNSLLFTVPLHVFSTIAIAVLNLTSRFCFAVRYVIGSDVLITFRFDIKYCAEIKGDYRAQVVAT